MNFKNTHFLCGTQACNTLDDLLVVLNGIREDGRKGRNM